MASESVIDIDALLAPIDASDPAGPADQDKLFFDIKDARTAARDAAKAASDALVQGRQLPSQEEENKSWKKISSLAPRYLTQCAKDFRVAMWLLEALVRSDGFAGLRDGLRLAAGLLEAFGNDLHPRRSAEEPMITVETLTALAGKEKAGALIPPLRDVPISDYLDPGPVTYFDYLATADGRTSGSEDSPLDREGVNKSILLSPPSFTQNLVEELRASLKALDELQAVIGRLYGNTAPSTANIGREIEAILDVLPAAADADADRDKGDGRADAARPADRPAGAAPAPGKIASREDAFQRLLKISEYFRSEEPQSLIAQAIEEVVRRGRLNLLDLVTELIPDEDQRRAFYRNAGIKPP